MLEYELINPSVVGLANCLALNFPRRTKSADILHPETQPKIVGAGRGTWQLTQTFQISGRGVYKYPS